MISVNTNKGAMVALQTLNKTNNELSVTQNRVSTGFKVSNAKDNGAIWAIANKMRSDVSAYDRVVESNDRAHAMVDTAVSAGESIMELLNEMKGKALAASQSGISATSRAALTADFVQLRDQITSIIANASFDGANMVGATPASAVSLGDANGGNSITVAGANLGMTAASATAIPADAILVFKDDITLVDTTATPTPASSAAVAATSLADVNTSITNLGTQLAKWGAGSKRLEAHKSFVGKLQDALKSGIGALTDADLSKESAKLQALQVKQQLGVQALSIANQSAQTALSLFK